MKPAVWNGHEWEAITLVIPPKPTYFLRGPIPDLKNYYPHVFVLHFEDQNEEWMFPHTVLKKFCRGGTHDYQWLTIEGLFLGYPIDEERWERMCKVMMESLGEPMKFCPGMVDTVEENGKFKFLKGVA